MKSEFFFDRFLKYIQISSFMKIRLVAAEMFHADGQTDMMEPTVAFRSFANAPKMQISLRHQQVYVIICVLATSSSSS